ncbi:hypothetical protein SARC_13605, partial [Sphaeroforma arctica JP610]
LAYHPLTILRPSWQIVHYRYPEFTDDSSADGQICRECPAGFYSDTDSVDQPCMPCVINNMQEKTGQTECVPCGWGKYTEEI